MSREAMEAVARYSDVSRRDPLARAVLDVIARLTGPEGGEVWPSLRTIAEEARCDKDTVTRKVAMLEDAGEVSVRREGKGRGARTYYRLLLPMEAREGDEDAPRWGEGRPVVYTAVEGQDLATEVADLRRQLAELQATVTRLAAVVNGGFNVPTEPEYPPHWPDIVPLMSENVPTHPLSVGTIPPPPPLFDGDINGVIVPTMSENVPTDQRSMGTIEHGDINDYCPQECPQMSPTMSPNVPTPQRGMGTETNRNQLKPIIIKTTGAEPTQKDPALQATWAELRVFLDGVASERGTVLGEDEAKEQGRAVWMLMRHFCEVGQFGPIPLDTDTERRQLAVAWWPQIYRWLEVAEWDVAICQAAMGEAFAELDSWKPGVVSSPKSLNGKVPAILAARKRGATAVVQVDQEELQSVWSEVVRRAPHRGQLRPFLEQNPRAKVALSQTGLQQADLRTLRAGDTFTFRRFAEAYNAATV